MKRLSRRERKLYWKKIIIGAITERLSGGYLNSDFKDQLCDSDKEEFIELENNISNRIKKFNSPNP